MAYKKWNTNERLPDLERAVIFVTYDGKVFIDFLEKRECGIRFYCNDIDWFNIKLWQYVGVMFAEELGLYVKKEQSNGNKTTED